MLTVGLWLKYLSCELELLLAADKARKSKFQKPKRQEQWQMELDALWKVVS